MTCQFDLTITYNEQQLRMRAPYYFLIATIRYYINDNFHELPPGYYLNHATFGSIPTYYRLGEMFSEQQIVQLAISAQEIPFAVGEIKRNRVSFVEISEIAGQDETDTQQTVVPFVDIQLPQYLHIKQPAYRQTIKLKYSIRVNYSKTDTFEREYFYFAVDGRLVNVCSKLPVDQFCVAVSGEFQSCGFSYAGVVIGGYISLASVKELHNNQVTQPFEIELLGDLQVVSKSRYFSVNVDLIEEFGCLSDYPLIEQYANLLDNADFRKRCAFAFYESLRCYPEAVNGASLLDDYYHVIVKSFQFEMQFSLFLNGGQIEPNVDPNKYRCEYFPDLLYQINDEYTQNKEKLFKVLDVGRPELPAKAYKIRKYSVARLSANEMFDQISGNLFLISMQLINGSRPISQEVYSSIYHTGYLVEGSSFQLTFNQHFVFPIKYKDIPSGTYLCLTIWLFDRTFLSGFKLSKEDMQLFDYIMYKANDSAPLYAFSDTIKGKLAPGSEIGELMKAGLVPIGSVIQDVYDAENRLVVGTQQVSLYPDTTFYQLAMFSIYQQNVIRQGTNKLTYHVPLHGAFVLEADTTYSEEITAVSPTLVESFIKRYANNPLREMSNENYEELYDNRLVVLQEPSLLPVVMKSIPIHKSEYYRQYLFMIRLMKNTELKIETILELLDYEYPDIFLREMAFEKLKYLSIQELALFIPQLTQVLKFERSNNLHNFLLQTAIENYDLFGWSFFWSVRSQMRHSFGYYNQYQQILIEFLKTIDAEKREDLLLAEQVSDFLIQVTQNVNLTKELTTGNKTEQQYQYMRQQFSNFNYQLISNNILKFKTPLSNAIYCTAIIVEKCKVMDSKKTPLMISLKKLQFQQDESPEYIAMSKSGDDLRQDALTIQILRMFDAAWKRAGLATIMQPYEVVPTGPDYGFIEIVRDAETLARITAQHGATGAFKKTPILQWLDKQKSAANSMMQICDKFYKSTAAYCVATYILGIGDRHNDNVMLTRHGEFFHIDFGHFLGNFKKKFGIYREKAPFFFTPDLKFVMEQCDLDLQMTSYQSFIQLCQVAYNEARKQGILLIVMMKMMCNTGIAELSSIDDLEWLIDTLLLNSSDDQASKEFARCIKEAVNSIATQFNNYCHIIAHY